MEERHLYSVNVLKIRRMPGSLVLVRFVVGFGALWFSTFLCS
jgi:hypothetical protein